MKDVQNLALKSGRNLALQMQNLAPCFFFEKPQLGPHEMPCSDTGSHEQALELHQCCLCELQVLEAQALHYLPPYAEHWAGMGGSAGDLPN